MNCPSCGAPLRVTSGLVNLRCDYCKSIVYKAPDADGMQYLGEDGEMPCPVCSVPLWSVALAGLPFHSCKQCNGSLVPMGEFEPLIEKLRADHPEQSIPVAADAADLDERVDCPKCHHKMDTHYYFGGGHAVMSSCEFCELHWLGGGVMMQIVRAPRKEETAPSF